jgi:hypothetical protein
MAHFLSAMRLFLSLWELTLWAMGVDHALKAIAHGVGSYKKAIP